MNYSPIYKYLFFSHHTGAVVSNTLFLISNMYIPLGISISCTPTWEKKTILFPKYLYLHVMYIVLYSTDTAQDSVPVTFWTYVWKIIGSNQGCGVICPDCGDPWFLQSLKANARTII
jgi:hypothetical protein